MAFTTTQKNMYKTIKQDFNFTIDSGIVFVTKLPSSLEEQKITIYSKGFKIHGDYYIKKNKTNKCVVYNKTINGTYIIITSRIVTNHKGNEDQQVDHNRAGYMKDCSKYAEYYSKKKEEYMEDCSRYAEYYSKKKEEYMEDCSRYAEYYSKKQEEYMEDCGKYAEYYSKKKEEYMEDCSKYTEYYSKKKEEYMEDCSKYAEL
jgi:hypothetical protein